MDAKKILGFIIRRNCRHCDNALRRQARGAAAVGREFCGSGGRTCHCGNDQEKLHSGGTGAFKCGDFGSFGGNLRSRSTNNQLDFPGLVQSRNNLEFGSFVNSLLFQNELLDQDMLPIAAMLGENHSLRQLYLAHNQIKDWGLAELGQGLLENAPLTILDLSGNKIKGTNGTFKNT